MPGSHQQSRCPLSSFQKLNFATHICQIFHLKNMRSYPNTQPFTSLVWFRIKQSGGSLNSRIWWSLNLRIWESLNPRIWGSLNSRIWASLNPRIWGSLNPRIWGSLHHRISGSLNPRIWGSLYPRIWGSLILCINNNISKLSGNGVSTWLSQPLKRLFKSSTFPHWFSW